MTKPKHTPGPWEPSYGPPSTNFGSGYGKSQIVTARPDAETILKRDGAAIRTVDNRKAIAGVAMVEPNDGPLYRNGNFSEEAFQTLEANARLIAAAPEMLDVLYAVVNDDGDGLLPPGPLSAGTWKKVYRIIEKIEKEG